MSKLDILYWNVYVGHNPADVRTELIDLVKQTNPDIIGIGEGMRVRDLELPGYKHYTYHPVENNTQNFYNADTAVFVRNDIKLESYRWLEMTKWWNGPKHGYKQPPKRYFASKVHVGDEIWRVSIGHWPFNLAVPETLLRIANWFRRAKNAKRVSIHLGDLNTRPDDLQKFVRTFGAHQSGEGVDRAIFDNCTVECRALAKHGSDHHAMIYHFRTA